MQTLQTTRTHSGKIPKQSRRQVRFEALDSWRGLAAIAVVLFHAQIISHIHDLAIVRAGEALVDFFFVLSGFVIAHAYLGRIGDPPAFGRFLLLRLGRVYPLHLFMLGLFLAFEAAKAFLPGLTNPSDPVFSEANAPETIPSNLLLLHSMRFDGLLTWNTPSWSISAEVVCYLAFGLALLYFRRYFTWVALAAVVAAPVVLAAFSEHGMESTASFGAVRALFGFSAGVLVYRLSHQAVLAARDGPDRGGAMLVLGWTLAEAIVTALVVWLVVAARTTAFAYAAPLAYCLLVAVFAVERGLLSRVLKMRALLFLGLISYSLYMTHMFVQLRMTNVMRLVDRFLGTEWVTQVGRTARYGGGIDTGNLYLGDLLMLLMLAATVLMSWLTWRFIEVPGRDAFRRLASRLFGAARRRDKRKGPLAAALLKS